MPDSLHHFFNLALIFICLVFTSYVTRMLLRFLVQRFRFLYGRKPTSPQIPPPPLPCTQSQTQNPVETQDNTKQPT